MGIGLISLITNIALAELPWYIGKEIAGISIATTEGYVPSGDLHQLLQTQVGESLFVGSLRQDVKTLYTLGSFESVEVDIRSIDLDQKLIQVDFRIQEAPRLTDIQISGLNFQLKEDVLSESKLSKGEVFFAEFELPRVEKRIYARLRAEGWNEAKVHFEQKNIDNKVYLNIDIDLGQPREFSEIRLSKVPEELKRKVQRKLWRLGIQKGKRVRLEALKKTKEELDQLLFAQGWWQGRVQLMLQTDPDGKESISILFAPGDRTIFDIQNRDLPRGDELLLILGIYQGERITIQHEVEFTERIRQWYHDKGFLEANVSVRVTEKRDHFLVQIDVDKGKPYRVGEIIFEENQFFTNEELLSTLLSGSDHLSRDELNRDELTAGAKTIQKAYYAEGFLDAEVSVGVIEISSERQRKRHDIGIKIIEKQQTTIGRVEVAGGIEEIHKPFIDRLNKKGIYRPKQIETIIGELEKEYQSQGYLFVNIKVDTLVNLQDSVANIRFEVEENELIYLRNVGIRGNQYTEREVLNSVLAIEVGKPITPQALEDTRANLYDLNLFETINVHLVGEDDAYQDVLIQVDERASWTFGTGGSLATDVGGLATTSVTRRNLFGQGHSATVFGQFGYSWNDDLWRFDVEEPIWRVVSQFSADRTPFSFSDFQVEAILREIIQEPNYRMLQSGGGGGFNLHPGRNVNLLFEYRVQKMMLDDWDQGLIVQGEYWEDVLNSGSNLRWWSGLQGSLVLDYRNDPFNPTAGSIWSGKIHIGDGFINEVPTVRLIGDLSFIQPIGGFRYKCSMGWGLGRTADETPLPLEERFFLGGPNNLRGFFRNQVGPANEVMWSNFDYPSQINQVIDQGWKVGQSSRWIHTGGDVYGLVNLELHWPMTSIGFDSGTLVGFVDAGTLQFISNINQTDSEIVGADPLFRWNIGIGIRYATVIGPIVFDLGINPSQIEERNEAFIVPNISFGSF